MCGARTQGSARGPMVPDLNSVCVVTNHEHSLAGRPIEEGPHHLLCCLVVCFTSVTFTTGHIVRVFSKRLANSQKNKEKRPF